MKKYIILLFAIVVSPIVQGQVNNWDSVVVDGFGLQEKITRIASYDGSVYAGTRQVVPGQAPMIYSSTTGDMASWNPTNFNTIASTFDLGVFDFEVDTAIGGKMYVATDNSEDGVMIYKFDGTSWYNLSGTTPPWDSTYSSIGKMVLYSGGGGTDSLFVFLNSPSNNASQIWKTEKNSSTWSLVLQLAPGTSSLADAIVYNDSIFFVNNDNNLSRSFVYKMTNGADTAKTHQYEGINSSGNMFSCLGIFKNYLYVGSHNYSGGNILRYNAANGWQVITPDGLGYNSTLNSINDFYTYRNKLWIIGTGIYGNFIDGARYQQGNTIMGGAVSPELFLSHDGVNFIQSATDGFRSASNYGNVWQCTSLGDNIYAGGESFSSPVGGEIWRSTVPLASFISSHGDTVCGGTNVTYTNTSQGAFMYKWYINGALYSTSTDISHVFPSYTTDTITLVAFSADSSYTDTFQVMNTSYVIGANANISPTYCIGSTVYPGNIINLYYGTLPYTYNWTDGVTNLSGLNAGFTITGPTSYTLYVSDALGCSAGFSTPTVNTRTNSDLFGAVTTATSVPIDNGLVYAFKYQPGLAGLDTVGSVPLAATTGDYLFAGLDSGMYLIKVVANPTSFPNTVPTYYGNEFQWDSAVVVYHGCSQIDTANIDIIEVLGGTGPGTISGYIIEEAGYGTIRINGNGGHQPDVPCVPGGPLKGIDVKLGKNPGGGIQARVFTDSTGYYEFDNLPLQGYRIYVDIPNLPMDTTREVVLAVGSEVSVQNNYYADSVYIYINPNTNVGIYTSDVSFENHFSIYPNPAKTDLTISYELKEEGSARIELTDVMGQIMRIQNINHSAQGFNSSAWSLVDLHLKSGVYFISLIKDNKKYTQRLIVID